MGKGLLWRFTVGSMVLLGSILPTLAESPAQEVAVELGDDVQLNCSFPVTEGVIPSLNWQKQPKIIYVREMAIHSDSRISLAADIPNGVYNLVISGTKLSDSGTYACVNQEGDAEEKLFSLKVQLRPTIGYFPEAPVTKVVGDGISLACNASGIPSPTITWRKGGTTIPSHVIFSQDGQILTIEEATETDSGSYECTAANGVGFPAVKTVIVNVQFPPEIVFINKSQVHTGTTRPLLLQCGTKGSPVPEIKWHLHGESIPTHFQVDTANVNQQYLSTLRVESLRATDLGEYKCTAENALGEAEAIVIVTGEPENVTITSNPEGPFSNEFTLTWTVKEYEPTIEYKLKLRTVNGTEAGPWVNSSIPAQSEEGSIEQQQSFTLEGLEPLMVYQVELVARNKFGESGVVEFTFKTAEAGKVRPSTTMSTTTTTTMPPPTTTTEMLQGSGSGKEDTNQPNSTASEPGSSTPGGATKMTPEGTTMVPLTSTPKEPGKVRDVASSKIASISITIVTVTLATLLFS